MIPPKRNEKNIFLIIGDFGECFFISLSFSFVFIKRILSFFKIVFFSSYKQV